MDGAEKVGISICCLIICVGIIGIIDGVYQYPKAAEKANQICEEQGYDFYEDFSRVGILSSEPVAVICKYVENYKEVDMNINRID